MERKQRENRGDQFCSGINGPHLSESSNFVVVFVCFKKNVRENCGRNPRIFCARKSAALSYPSHNQNMTRCGQLRKQAAAVPMAQGKGWGGPIWRFF